MALAVMFLQGTSAPHSAWTVAGIGIRIAQDVGAHRRKVYRGGQGSIEDELWKRAFWITSEAPDWSRRILVVHDRVTSSALGRPCAIQDEDSDVGFPVEVDDEYWPHIQTDPAFVPTQPAGVPPRSAFFNCYLKLIQILGFALRTIYSINKSKILLGFVGPQWEQHIVAELDSALNKWIDSVPDHLRWDPNRENSLFFDQSATLYSTYYHVQILIHRPFIPSPRKPSPLSFPSLAICTTAARSCSHVLDLQRRRSQTILPGVMVAAFTSGIVLLINSTPYGQPLPTPPTFGVANLPVNTAELGSMHHLPPDFMFEQQNNPLHGIWNEQSHDPLVSLFGNAGTAQGQGQGYTGGAESSAGVGYYPPAQPQQQTQPTQGYPTGAAYMGEQSSGFVPGMAAQPFVGGGAFEMWQQAPPGFEVADWGVMLSQDMLGTGQGVDSRASTLHGVNVGMGQHPGQMQMPPH
ncbi:hypothetical protein FRC11_010206 [Ceratobasidium sp. 423]|nr:hypothetical protein FRC11_010206 [Ceratobasidium sp. 423]